VGKRLALLRKLDAQTRDEVRQRDHDQCVVCKRQASQVHEIVPRSHFGLRGLPLCFDIRNRACLCQECHEKAHTRPARVALLQALHECYGYDYSQSPWAAYLDQA
jgi:5-methylcytosine-specific restriction endonuclease McrA